MPVQESLTRLHQPDLVVLDQRMTTHPPNGFAALQQLRVQATTGHIPVILYSAKGTFLQSHQDEVRNMGGDILHKPFNLEEFVAKIEALALLSNAKGSPE